MLMMLWHLLFNVKIVTHTEILVIYKVYNMDPAILFLVSIFVIIPFLFILTSSNKLFPSPSHHNIHVQTSQLSRTCCYSEST